MKKTHITLLEVLLSSWMGQVSISLHVTNSGGITHTYPSIGLCNAAAISDMSRNGYLSRPTTKKYLKEGNRGLFRDFPEELGLTALMAETDDAPATHKSNNQSLELKLERR